MPRPGPEGYFWTLLISRQAEAATRPTRYSLSSPDPFEEKWSALSRNSTLNEVSDP